MGGMEQTGIHPAVIEAIRLSAQRWGLRAVTLFGSRARGEQRPKSDINLALSGGDQVRFALDVEENAPTLLSFDFVDLDGSVQQELRETVAREGRLSYEEVR